MRNNMVMGDIDKTLKIEVKFMTKRFCDLCGWKTPSTSIYIVWKKKRVNIGYMCLVCGKTHTRHFPKLMLLRDDALAIKEGKRKLIEFQPRTDATKKLTTLEVY